MKNESRHLQLNEAKWDRWAVTFDDENRRTDFLRKLQSALISFLDVKENMCVLDIGCGTGWALGQIARKVNGQGEFYGVDLSPKMIDKAKENFRDRGNFHFIKANSESVPIDDNQFDVIICTSSFHHYLHPEKALKEMKRMLKDDGRVYILDPAADSWLIKLADKVLKRLEPEHVKIYSTIEFQKMFVDTGLRYVEAKPVSRHQKVHVGEKGR